MRGARVLLFLLLVATGAAASADEGPDITFLAGDAAREAIVDESMEPYFSLLQPMEMQAKTGSALPGETLEEQRAACRKRYQAAVGAFSEPEQEAIRWYVGKYHEMLHETYPRFTKTPWRLVKLNPPVEGGLPHTRGTVIVLPPGIVRMLVIAKTRGPVGALPGIGGVLLHEQLHVVQRLHRERMEHFYREIWKYVHAERIERGAWLVRHQVINPDGVDARWVFELEDEGEKRWVLPDVMLTEGEGPKQFPGDLQMVVLELEKTEQGFVVKTDRKGVPVYESLRGCEHWQATFPGTSTSYHPNETMADLFVKLVVSDHVLMDGPDVRPVLKRYRSDFRRLLGD